MQYFAMAQDAGLLLGVVSFSSDGDEPPASEISDSALILERRRSRSARIVPDVMH